MAKGAKKPETYMVIEEVVTIDDGERAGDLVINVVATRKGKSHRLPYHIAKKMIPTISLEALKEKVIVDLDKLDIEQSKYDAVIAKLTSQTGNTIDLG